MSKSPGQPQRFPVSSPSLTPTPTTDDDQRPDSPCVRELADARERFAAAFLELPDAVRRQALGRDRPGPDKGRRWSLAKADACWQRLLELERATDDTTLRVRVRRLAAIKSEVERLRDRIVVDNLRLVPHVVHQIGKNHQVPVADLIQEGNLGLMRAVDLFDPEMGNRFSTYAYWWIRQAVFKAIEDKARIIRLPSHVLNSRRKLSRFQTAFRENHDRDPTAGEVADHLGITRRKANDLMTLVGDPLSFEQSDGDQRLDLGDSIPADGPTPLDTILETELLERLEAAMGALTEREQAILRLRFGIGPGAARTLREIGEIFSLTRERVRQIERRALAKLSAADRETFGGATAMTA